ncbi:MAG: DUF3368 domain-containing protein [Verrucomicrobia bacterium]|nr:DUF3368 domain-containing protein [Verrucomicrobiota bacterium]
MIVINSSPVINLTAALGGLELLGDLYGKVIVPAEVMQEIEDGADKDKAADLLRKTHCADMRTQTVLSAPWMFRGLDPGEASVIQTALQEGVKTVVLDDWKGRRVARVAGLEVIGSLGVLVQAKETGRLPSVRDAITRMKSHGAWLDGAVVEQALKLAGES